MWRSSVRLLYSSSYGLRSLNYPQLKPNNVLVSHGFFSFLTTRSSFSDNTTTDAGSCSNKDESSSSNGGGNGISVVEAKRLMRLANVEALKLKLGMEEKEVISYSELLAACECIGVTRSPEEAASFAKVLDEAGVILLFRDKVYLHPDKVVDLFRKAMPLALTPEDDPRREELKQLQERKEQIDMAARKQVSRILWSGLGLSVFQVGLFFRLTFWEFSWDVMEPIAFFTTTSGIVIGYAYFLFTSRDPSYQDMMSRLFLARQRKLYKKWDFDANRYMELQKRCKCPLDLPQSLKGAVGLGLEHEKALHGDAAKHLPL